MNEFYAGLVALIESEISLLKKKVQPSMVLAGTPVPFAMYSEAIETPRRTKDGIAAMVTSIEISAFHTPQTKAVKLKSDLITLLDRKDIKGYRLLFQSSEYGFYETEKLHGYTLTFNIKKI